MCLQIAVQEGAHSKACTNEEDCFCKEVSIQKEVSLIFSSARLLLMFFFLYVSEPLK